MDLRIELFKDSMDHVSLIYIDVVATANQVSVVATTRHKV